MVTSDTRYMFLFEKQWNELSPKQTVPTSCSTGYWMVLCSIGYWYWMWLIELCLHPVFTFGYSKMTSLTEDVRRSAMLCVLSVPTTMTSHDLMKFVAPYNDVMEHMKIIRDSTPNQYMVLIKFATQVSSCSCQPGFLHGLQLARSIGD